MPNHQEASRARMGRNTPESVAKVVLREERLARLHHTPSVPDGRKCERLTPDACVGECRVVLRRSPLVPVLKHNGPRVSRGLLKSPLNHVGGHSLEVAGHHRSIALKRTSGVVL
eukprot:7378399-Prymnesium_polylepis.2